MRGHGRILRHWGQSEAIKSIPCRRVWIASSLQCRIASQFCHEILARTKSHHLATCPTRQAASLISFFAACASRPDRV